MIFWIGIFIGVIVGGGTVIIALILFILLGREDETKEIPTPSPSPDQP
jgi:hypothetical protein